MSAPFKFDLEASAPLGKDTATPADLAIRPRDRRFCRKARPVRWWLGNDPVATAWHNSLSVAFPVGESFFIEHVKAHREGVPPKLEAEIRAFVRQEINHTREHVAFNRYVTDAGYDISRVEQRLNEAVQVTRERPAIANLAASMALEHFTAIIARHTLTHLWQYGKAEPEVAELWRWHAVEEIEHKGVTYDTWLHATRDWTRFRRWWVKSLLMILAGRNFLKGRIQDTLDFLAQDGLTGWKWKWRVGLYLVGRPGVLRKIFPDWVAYFLPGFHPWKTDDRALIHLYDSEYADAVMPVEMEETVPAFRKAASAAA
ncbi:metal-dependent hydrolase [Erythrobacter sp. SG61-1L]|uniref:metal-dependent hydrolase n=1 Tax=Erythrobacter sp. SG61-1L TaxID=1603897 RepID=UPI0006C90029|nr:metal-dependent hydrolase [Erythrobacter sp. SG61-1L]